MSQDCSSWNTSTFNHGWDTTTDGPTAPKRFKTGRYGDGQRSAVWEYFDFDEAIKKSKCRLCGHLVSGKNPGELKKHIDRHSTKCSVHKIASETIAISTSTKRTPTSAAVPFLVHAERSMHARIQPTANAATPTVGRKPMLDDHPPSTNDKSSISDRSPKYRRFLESLSTLLATHSLPHSMIESPEFCQLLKTLNPRVRPPTRRDLRRLEAASIFEDNSNGGTLIKIEEEG